MPHIECLLGMLNEVLFKLTHKITVASSFLAIAKVFVARTGNAQAYAELFPVTQTMQVALVPLGLVSTQAPLISCSTRSAKLPFFQKAMAVVVIVEFKTTRMEEGGVCTSRTEYSSKRPLPIFVQK